MVAGLLLLAGCTPADTPEVLTPQEAQAELLAILDDTEAAVGGTWRNDDDASPLACELGSGEKGVTFSGYRRSSDPVEAEAGVEAVVAFWESRGFDVERRPELAGLDDVFVRFAGEPDRYLHFAIGQNIMAVEGWGRCVPGDVLDEIERLDDAE